MTTASAIARYIINSFQEAGDPVSNLKLQKLLYYVQGWHLALLDEPAFPERLEAWIHGPVQPGVYGEYKRYRWNPIGEPVEAPELDGDLTALVQEVLTVYGTDSAYELEVRTHREDPWREARGNLPRDCESSAVITQESMQRFFKKFAESDDEDQEMADHD